MNALIVISLIIRHNEITKELSDCIGAPHIASKKPKVQQDARVEWWEKSLCGNFVSVMFTHNIIFSAEIEDEEIDDFDLQEQITESEDLVTATQSVDINATPKISWLLQVVLRNLGVTVNDSSVTIFSVESSPHFEYFFISINSSILLCNQ